MSYSSSIFIEELDAQRTTLRMLTLVGPAMPKMGAGWPEQNGLSTKWYPGNPVEATQHVLVSKLMPSRWEFSWSLTMLNRRPSRYVDSNASGSGVGPTTAVVTPGFLLDVLSDMMRKGRRLRVTWASNSDNPQIARTVVREGRIAEVDPTYRGPVDLDATVEFHWVSTGSSTARVAPTRDAGAAGATTALQAAMAGTQAAITALLAEENDPTLDTLGLLEKITQGILSVVGALSTTIENDLFSLQQIGSVATQLKNLPFQVAAQVVGVAADVKSGCQLFVDQIGGTPSEVAMEKQSDDVASMLATQVALGEAVEQAYLTARAAQSAQQQVRAVSAQAGAGGGIQSAQALSATRTGNILAVRVTKDGDTPTSLSALYYGSPDHEIDILRANDLPWYQATFATGTILVIPFITATQSP